MIRQINIVLDAPPGPEAGRFVEVENEHGRSFNAGEWVKRDDDLWELRLNTYVPVDELPDVIHLKAARNMFLVGLGFGVFVGLALYSMAMALVGGHP